MNKKARQARDDEAVRLRGQGLTYQQIAGALKCSVGTANNAVKRWGQRPDTNDFRNGHADRDTQTQSVSTEEPTAAVPSSDDSVDTADAAFWADPPVHPAAQLLPMMADAELGELAADIEANGMMEPIILWRNDADELFLLDGRNRLAALARLGITNPDAAPPGPGGAVKPVCIIDGGDPTTYVLSANVHRRHLNAEQKRAALAAYLKADPTVSDRTVAKDLGVDHKTAAKVRDELEGRGEIPHAEKRTDSKGRKQPAKKPTPTPPDPEPAASAETLDLSDDLHDESSFDDIDAAPLKRADDPAARQAHELQADELDSAASDLEDAAATFQYGLDDGLLLSPEEARKLAERIDQALNILLMLRDELGELGAVVMS
jgi:ParB-like chromosome segregation protein Spo0J